MTKDEIVEQLKIAYPTLTKFIDGEDIELSPDEYDAQIAEWADLQIAQEAELVLAEQKAAEKQAILDRLGLTADEAKLILS